jgi:UTP:GlnB (protein PII) uridylyltransferase
MHVNQVAEFIQDFIAWVSSQPDIQGVALVGSYARNAATESSDVDLVILAKNPEQFILSASWVHLFGEVSRQQTEDYGALTSIRVGR